MSALTPIPLYVLLLYGLFLAASYRFRWHERAFDPCKRSHRAAVAVCAALCLLPAAAVLCALPHENTAYPFLGFLENEIAYNQQFDAFLKGQLALDFQPDARILDLGCGKGISSLFLYRKYRAQVYAVDLWIPPTENLARFSAAGAA